MSVSQTAVTGTSTTLQHMVGMRRFDGMFILGGFNPPMLRIIMRSTFPHTTSFRRFIAL
jgi:hypothetical protein